MFGRNQHNSVKQLAFNLKINQLKKKKLQHVSWLILGLLPAMFFIGDPKQLSSSSSSSNLSVAS